MRGLDTGRIDPRIVRVITVLALTVSLLIMVALPTAYFVAARVATDATLRARADSAASVMTDFVTRNPEHWMFENARIRGRLTAFVEPGAPEQWRVLDGRGSPAAVFGQAASSPAVTITADIYDSGVVTGQVQVSRSIQDIVGWTSFLAVIGIALAGGSFILLRSLPLRLLAESMERLAQFQARERERAAQLAQASKLAQLGELATGVAHELNQPLTAITLAAQNALKQVERGAVNQETLAARLDRIVQMARRASTVIDHMRVFGRMGGEPSGPIAIAAAVRGARDLLAFKLQRQHIVVEEVLPPDLPPVIGQAVPLEQVLVNLIGNACDAYGVAEEDDPARVVTVTAALEGDRVTLRVHDAAGGIPLDVLPRIFAPFFTTKPVGQGTGLGLSISYGIITDMGGTLAADSADGTTTFTITLPAAPDGAQPAAPDRSLPAA